MFLFNRGAKRNRKLKVKLSFGTESGEIVVEKHRKETYVLLANTAVLVYCFWCGWSALIMTWSIFHFWWFRSIVSSVCVKFSVWMFRFLSGRSHGLFHVCYLGWPFTFCRFKWSEETTRVHWKQDQTSPDKLGVGNCERDRGHVLEDYVHGCRDANRLIWRLRGFTKLFFQNVFRFSARIVKVLQSWFGFFG